MDDNRKVNEQGKPGGYKNTGASSESKPTVIGESILIRGEVSGKEDLIIKGKIEGNINLKKHLLIDMTGDVKADIDTSEIKVSGKLTGNIIATNRVEITDHGKMTGDIKSPRVVLADGAVFRGSIDMQKGTEDKE